MKTFDFSSSATNRSEDDKGHGVHHLETIDVCPNLHGNPSTCCMSVWTKVAEQLTSLQCHRALTTLHHILYAVNTTGDHTSVTWRMTQPLACMCAGVAEHGPEVPARLKWANQSQAHGCSGERARTLHRQIHMPYHLKRTLSYQAAASWFPSAEYGSLYVKEANLNEVFILFSSFSPIWLKSHLGKVIWVDPVKGEISHLFLNIRVNPYLMSLWLPLCFNINILFPSGLLTYEFIRLRHDLGQ